jgi:hypothetical protein
MSYEPLPRVAVFFLVVAGISARPAQVEEKQHLALLSIR